MPHKKEDFFLHAGETATVDVTIEDEDNGTLEGATIHFWAGRSKSTLPDKVNFKKSSADGGDITIIDAAARKVRISFVPDDTLMLYGNFVYEVWVYDAAGNKLLALEGILTIHRTITRP